MRDMDEIKPDFADRGVRFVAVNVFEDVEAVKAFAVSSGFDYEWALAGDEAAGALGIESIPAMIVLDPEGRVAWRSGLMTSILGLDGLRGALDDLTGG